MAPSSALAKACLVSNEGFREKEERERKRDRENESIRFHWKNLDLGKNQPRPRPSSTSLSTPPREKKKKKKKTFRRTDLLADQKGLPRDQVTSWTPFPGGAPANVACAVSTLGKKAAFVSALGADALGDDFLEVLRAKRVDVDSCGCVQRVPDRPTRDVYVVYNGDGDREFVGFGEHTPTEGYADCFLDAAKLPTELLSSAGALVTGTLGLAYPKTAEAMARAVEVARGAGVPVVVDVNWRPVFFAEPGAAATREGIRAYVLGSADVVKLSDEEAEWLFGVPAAEALRDPEEVLRRLLGGGGGEEGASPPSSSSSSSSSSAVAVGVLVTGGGLGASYAFLAPEGKNATSGFLPALRVEATDTTGAGDAFLGGFLAAMLDAGGLGALRADPEKLQGAVAFAAAAGAATTTAPGAIAAQPGREAVEALLKKSSGL